MCNYVSKITGPFLDNRNKKVIGYSFFKQEIAILQILYIHLLGKFKIILRDNIMIIMIILKQIYL